MRCVNCSQTVATSDLGTSPTHAGNPYAVISVHRGWGRTEQSRTHLWNGGYCVPLSLLLTGRMRCELHLSQSQMQ